MQRQVTCSMHQEKRVEIHINLCGGKYLLPGFPSDANYNLCLQTLAKNYKKDKSDNPNSANFPRLCFTTGHSSPSGIIPITMHSFTDLAVTLIRL